MTCLLHISDPHFGTEQPRVMQALMDLSGKHCPDLLVLSGDITQRARLSQFQRASEFCERLGIAHRLSLPGNHDIPLFNLFQRFFTPYANYLRFFGPDLQPLASTPSVIVIGVKTTRRWRHKNGEVSGAQIDSVARQLSSADPEKLKVVVVHQPVYVPRPEDEHDRLRNWEPAVRAWSRAGADIVMGGHIHLPYVRDLSEAVPDLGRRMWCVQAGTALSSRVRHEAPNSVNILRYEAGRWPPACLFERWDFEAASRQFKRVIATSLLLDRLPL